MQSENKKTILLVEDEAIIAIAGKKTLEARDYNVITANSGEAAFSLFMNNMSIDIILMDIDLGKGMDGTETAKLILAEREIPVIFLSSHSEPDVVSKTEKITSYGYVVKNSGITVLDASIKMAFKLFEAHLKLQKSEKLLQNIFDNVPIGMFQSTKEGKFINVNKALPVILGYDSQEELIEKINSTSIADALYVDPALRPKLVDEVVQSLASWKIFDNRYYCKDGSIIDAILTFSEQEDPITGQILLNGFVRDITERKRLEQDMLRQKQYFEAILQTTSDGFWVVTPDKKILDANPAYCQMSGYTKDELMRMDINDLDGVENPQETAERMKRIIKNGSEIFETKHQRKDGSLLDVEISASLLDRSDGLCLVGFCRDITSRKLEEEAFQATIYELKKSQEVAKVGSWVWHIPQNLVEWSDEMYRIFSINKNLFTGDLTQVINESIHPDDRAEVNRSNASVMEKNNPIPLEYRIVRPDGSLRIVWAEAGELEHDAEGKPRLLRGIVHDITERKKAEESIKALLAEKELVLKEVHHRLKNNMNTVKGLLSLQIAFLKDPLAISALYDTISRVDSMLILYDKLYCSHNFNDISVLTYLPSLIDEIVSNFPGFESVKIVKEIDDFIIDFKKLQPLGIIINELLTNIMKYAFTGRDNNLIYVSAALNEGRVSIVISDNGNGIPELVTFENSTGYGMQLVSMLTEQMCGTIAIERVSGSRFILEFDLH